ncbi:MAG: DinB family protein [Bacteroidota bacterium]|nr:DinB family protein [Bacteroidota bacterium]
MPLHEVTILLQSVAEAYNKKSWHGTNLRGSIRGLTAKEAAWRLGKNRHNIWEIVVHCAYWKYAVKRRILGEKRGSFPLKGSNWFKRPDGQLNKEQWKQDIRLLEKMHCSMVEAISILKDADLSKTPYGSQVDNRSILTGIAMHDVYHAGQIQLIKKLIK